MRVVKFIARLYKTNLCIRGVTQPLIDDGELD